MRQPDLRDRYRATLVGVLAGDALGAPYETWSRDDVLADYGSRGGLVPFDYPDPWDKDGVFPAGRPTDDSELTAALADSLAVQLGMNLEDQFQRFKRAALDGESFLWDGTVKGFGGTTRKALSFQSFAESIASADVPCIPSNGSLMRSAPIALYSYGDEHEIEAMARASSRVTHRHEDALACCVLFARVHHNVLQGMDGPEAVADGIAGVDEWHIARAFRRIERPEIPARFPNRGAAILTLQAALWALKEASSFREGVTEVIALGGDTDTYAAVAGALLGARFGMDAIPEDWLRALYGRERMEAYADALYAARFG